MPRLTKRHEPKGYNGASWRAGKSATERGYTALWRKTRLMFLRAHPLCVMCEGEGRITAATVVDHVVPHKGNEALFWNPANWQPLCKRHHDSDKARMEHGNAPVPRIGMDGLPVGRSTCKS